MKNTVIDFVYQISNLSELEESKSAEKPYPDMPMYPTDIFLIMANLLESAGAFPHFDPAESAPTLDYPPTFGFSGEQKSKAISLGQGWRDAGLIKPYLGPPKEIYDLWNKFFAEHATEKLRTFANIKTSPTWWSEALFLLIVADEACEGIGSITHDSVPEFISEIILKTLDVERRDKSIEANIPDYSELNAKFNRATGSAASFAISGRNDFSNVFPKLNIGMRGCSHRNFSRNLTLLPKSGTVRCHWHASQRELAEDNEKTVDILVVPFPFEISAKAFREAGPAHTALKAMERSSSQPWANFDIDQSEYEEVDLINLVKGLIKSAKKDTDTVNGIIFPEYAMDFSLFQKLCIELKKPECEPNLEFIVAGSSSNCESEAGNYVLTGVWNALQNDSATKDKIDEFSIISSRRKHHRWMLDGSQIDGYGLSSTLDPRINWWENHIGGYRELHFYPFRKSSLFTTLICEDLARADPCHEVLKSVGPNLVFALLMDGPQLSSRWPGRYAKSLCEDINCSVLTATSYGLINRANLAAKHAKNETVVNFASPFGDTEIALPYSSGARGVLLSLTSEKLADQCSIDGRTKDHRAWRLAHSMPIIPAETSDPTPHTP